MTDVADWRYTEAVDATRQSDLAKCNSGSAPRGWYGLAARRLRIAPRNSLSVLPSIFARASITKPAFGRIREVRQIVQTKPLHCSSSAARQSE
jgi:hypothetical protein